MALMSDLKSVTKPLTASPAAAAKAIVGLSTADKLRIERFARLRAVSLGPVEWQDLLQEAIGRILSGSRRWPPSVPMVAFLQQTIRSVAHEERRRLIKRLELRESQLGPSDAGTLYQHQDDGPDALRALGAKEQLREILEAFKGDREVLLLIDGLAGGETALETQARAGFTSLAYDAARKRFRRKLNGILGRTETDNER